MEEVKYNKISIYFNIKSERRRKGKKECGKKNTSAGQARLNLEKRLTAAELICFSFDCFCFILAYKYGTCCFGDVIYFFSFFFILACHPDLCLDYTRSLRFPRKRKKKKKCADRFFSRINMFFSTSAEAMKTRQGSEMCVAKIGKTFNVK